MYVCIYVCLDMYVDVYVYVCIFMAVMYVWMYVGMWVGVCVIDEFLLDSCLGKRHRHVFCIRTYLWKERLRFRRTSAICAWCFVVSCRIVYYPYPDPLTGMPNPATPIWDDTGWRLTRRHTANGPRPSVATNPTARR
jgi:hypothetical protein